MGPKRRRTGGVGELGVTFELIYTRSSTDV